MKLVIQGKNIEITEAIHGYVHQKIEKAIDHYQGLMTEVDVHLSVARNPRIKAQQTTEVTIYANGAVIRAEESHENLYASVDLVANKIARKLRKYKEKRQRKTYTSGDTASAFEQQPVPSALTGDRDPQLPAAIVRNKYFAMPPMTIQAALEQLQLVDHDFYVFLNAETNQINVIYERNHGGYGVIQPRSGDSSKGDEVAGKRLGYA